MAAGNIDGRTAVCGLIGNPVEHTLSPDIHNTLAGFCGVNLAYVPFRVENGDLEAAVRGAYALSVRGLNVTVPYKKEVLPLLCGIDPLAKEIGAVNTLVRADGGFFGYNTDMTGLYRAMQEDGVGFEGEEVVLLGAGGVGRAVAFLCARKGAGRVYLLNRSGQKAAGVAKEVNERTGRDCVRAMELGDWRSLPKKRMLTVQATSAGLYPDCERAPIEDPDFYGRVETGYDLIYQPARTKFMRLAGEAGAKAYNGLKMLLWQGVEAFELMNGVAVPSEQAGRIYELLLKKTEI